jgi:hypothetical protein
MEPAVVRFILMYFILPLWLLAGLADYFCHRASRIEATSGPRESLLHLLQFGEMGVVVLAALFLEVNAIVLGAMMIMLVVHHATAILDVAYADARREVSPAEQHIHSVLEMLPLTGFLFLAGAHWPQFLAVFGFGPEPAMWELLWKLEPLPESYLATALVAAALLGAVPYLEELIRGLRYRGYRRPR